MEEKYKKKKYMCHKISGMCMKQSGRTITFVYGVGTLSVHCLFLSFAVLSGLGFFENYGRLKGMF